jgi:hypothetical protein
LSPGNAEVTFPAKTTSIATIAVAANLSASSTAATTSTANVSAIAASVMSTLMATDTGGLPTAAAADDTSAASPSDASVSDPTDAITVATVPTPTLTGIDKFNRTDAPLDPPAVITSRVQALVNMMPKTFCGKRTLGYPSHYTAKAKTTIDPE